MGGTIDSYDAVFRVNKVQLQTENRNAYSCKVGARVDFAINALTAGQFEELVNNSIAEKFLSQHKDVLNSLAGLGSATVTKDRDSYKAAVRAARVQNASDGWCVFLPSNAVLHGRGLGSGLRIDGRRACDVALSECRAYGLGLPRRHRRRRLSVPALLPRRPPGSGGGRRRSDRRRPGPGRSSETLLGR